MNNGQPTEEQVRLEVRNLIAAITEREPEKIPDTASFTDDLGVDSLMAMEVMVSMDKRFRIDIPEEEFMTATNVDQVVAMVLRHIVKPSGVTASA